LLYHKSNQDNYEFHNLRIDPCLKKLFLRQQPTPQNWYNMGPRTNSSNMCLSQTPRNVPQHKSSNCSLIKNQ